MELTSSQIAAWLGSFLWPFARVGAMVSLAPVFGSRIMPMRIKLLFALMLTWVVQPFVHSAPAVDPISVPGLLVMLHQVLIGIAMGLALQIAFAAVVMGGQILAMSMGLGFASMVDPQNGVQVPMISQYYLILAILLFFAFDGQLVLIHMVADSFRTLPVGTTSLTSEGLWNLVSWAGLVFAGGVLIALPVVTATLITNLAFGVATRAAPQLNIFAVGFPVILLVGFAAMFLTLPYFLPRFADLLQQSLVNLRVLTGAAA